jgi:hypothetical protein
MIQPLSCPHPRQPGTQLNWTKFAVKPEIRRSIFEGYVGQLSVGLVLQRTMVASRGRPFDHAQGNQCAPERVRSKRFVEPMKG